jgi:hypothetical protein
MFFNSILLSKAKLMVFAKSFYAVKFISNKTLQGPKRFMGGF